MFKTLTLKRYSSQLLAISMLVISLALSHISYAQTSMTSNALEDELIAPELAFIPSIVIDKSHEVLQVHWEIADGYYLYKDKLSFSIDNRALDLSKIALPEGTLKDDILFGLVQTYYTELSASIPATLLQAHLADSAKIANQITVGYQGCYDPLGICYPPQLQTLDIPTQWLEKLLASSNQDSSSQDATILASTENSSAFTGQANETILSGNGQPSWKSNLNFGSSEDVNFAINGYSTGAKTVDIFVDIPKDYYLYKDKFTVVSLSPGSWVKAISYSPTIRFDDPEFGNTEVFFDQATISLELSRYQADSNISVEVGYQGCKVGSICLPPARQNIDIALAAISADQLDNPNERQTLQQGDLSGNNETDNKISIMWLLLSAFGAGLLLTFTPCVLPMIPILASILGKQDQKNIVTSNNKLWLRNGFIAIAYVLGTAVTYGFIGAVAGASGEQLQAYFQTPLVLGIFSAILVLMALSLFGLYSIQMPAFIQNKISQFSQDNSKHNKKMGIFGYAFILGLLSAMIVGACVSPVLISIISLIIKQGSLWIGAITLFVMALGMGVILIAFAFGAHFIMPKSGAWMKYVNQIMGFFLIAVALYLLSAIPTLPTLWLFSGLLFVFAFYLLVIAQTIKHLFFKVSIGSMALFIIFWAMLSAFGAYLGNNNILQPINSNDISSLSSNENNQNTTQPQSQSALQKAIFNTITTNAELDTLLASNDKPFVLIDYYADWCKDCIRMEKSTYLDSKVLSILDNQFLVIKIDITDSYGDEAKQLKQRFGVYGPPATLFLDKQNNLLANNSFYGYRDSDAFIIALESVLQTQSN